MSEAMREPHMQEHGEDGQPLETAPLEQDVPLDGAIPQDALLHTVTREDNVSITTTRAPLRIDGKRPKTGRAAPLIGEQSEAIRREFGL